MNVMARFAKLDSAMQRGLDNAMAYVFGGRVVPEEIEELLKQEIQDNLSSDEEGTVYCPNVFAVGVSSKDLENLSQDQNLPHNFADQIGRFIRNHGWTLEGPVTIHIAEESGLRTGQLRVSSYTEVDPEDPTGFEAIMHEPGDIDAPVQSTNAHDDVPNSQENSPMNESTSQPHGTGADAHEAANPEMPSPGADAATTAFVAPNSEEVKANVLDQGAPADDSPREPVVSLLLQDGSSRSYLVQEGSNIIGRANDADLRLPDTGVSREHAEIMWNGHDAVLVDLESTNGTTVNDTPVDNWLLADGDVITVGHSNIEVRITQPES